MNIIKTQLHIGASTPFRAVHISDTHFTYADMRDGEAKVDLARGRVTCFPFDPEAILEKASETAKELRAPILHTGDLIDFVSVANLERAARFIAENDCFFAAGNHEFSLYVGEAWEDAAYRNQSLATVQEAFTNNIRMAARVIGGVNFVALDDGYYLFDEEQLAFLQSEVAKGLPVVLLMHNPLYEPTLYEKMMKKAPCAYIVDTPEELMQGYEEHRYRQQKADEITHRTVEYIARESAVKAIIAGHLHFDYEGTFAGRIPQIVTGCETVRVIEFT